MPDEVGVYAPVPPRIWTGPLLVVEPSGLNVRNTCLSALLVRAVRQ
jgi:hypothetical protein